MKTGSEIQDIRTVRLSISQQVAAPKEVNNKKGGVLLRRRNCRRENMRFAANRAPLHQNWGEHKLSPVLNVKG